MSNFKPTPSQENAIKARSSAILVSAGAGSGKTKVLIERLMGYIIDPNRCADLDSFVIITFTRAAAAELKSRIADELAKALAADPANRRLRRQNALIDKAQIGTIHSFCGQLIRENCHRLGISPDFKIVDDSRAAAMKDTALERTLNRHYDFPDKYPGFISLADTVGAGRGDERLSALVLELHAKMQSHARVERWAQQQADCLSEDVNDIALTVWGKEIMERQRSGVKYWADELDRVMQALSADSVLSAAYMPSISHSAECIRELDRCLRISWDKAREALPIPFDRLGSARNVENVQLQQFVKSRRESCAKAMEKLQAVFTSDSQKLLEEMRSTAPAMKALLELTLDFDREYSRDKQRAGLLDYSDLEHMTAMLLTNDDDTPNELSCQIASRYTEIMVDEYQDVNQVQDTIFRAVSKNGSNLFMVGDVKQSIYRFRLAQPEIFTEKYLGYADYGSAPETAPRRIMLRENFRSRQEIINCANRVFSLCMSRDVGDVDYDSNASLVCGAKYPESVQKPRLLILGQRKASPDDEDQPDKTESEARMVAQEILSLISRGAPVTENDIQRPMRYSDIAILLRSTKNTAPVFSRVLSQMGIPVTHAQGSDFFTTVEVSTVVSMLSVIDNPHQDIPLIAVLSSPAFGFSADELSFIRAGNDKADFYTALSDYAHGSTKAAAFIKKLSALRSVSGDITVSELTWKLLGELDMLSICSAMTDGDLRRQNLMELLELAERFQSTGRCGLHRYVLWLRRLAEKDSETGAGGSETSSVKIMTVHKSKGLEFPVVFLCDTARKFNLKENNAAVLIHPQLGLGPKVTDLSRRLEYPTLARFAISARNRSELVSEEMRLLYVALTRPKEYLFMTAVTSDPEKLVEKHVGCLSEPMDPQIISSSTCFLDWLLYAALIDEGRSIEYELRSETDVQSVSADAVAEQHADPASLDELEEKLSFVYPHADSVDLPSKVTATEMKGYQEADEDGESLLKLRRKAFALPDYERENKPLTGTERGNATHLVLQFMDFSRTGSLEAITSEIERLFESHFISQRDRDAVDANAILRLFSSPLGRRILSSKKAVREFKFSILCPAAQIFGRGGDDEQVLLQGVVDCCIEENGELTVIDYKTDSVRTAEDIRQRTEHYAPQLRAYAAALERIFGKKVKACVLYFITAGREVSVEM